MRISCVIVSYNNGELLEEAVMSVVRQTRPVEEIIVADDASTDGSHQLIEALSHSHPNIKPVFREENLGVSANRDLAMRDARGNFVTWLDGDDYFLPAKIEAEASAVGESHDVIAYSDVRIRHRRKNRVEGFGIADFSRLGASDRVRWLLGRKRQSPRSLLIPKAVHLRIGGYNHNLRTYEDWDYILRLAAEPLHWAHSGVEGTVAHPGGGLSTQAQNEHMRDELRVLRLNYRLIRRHLGLPILLATAGRVVATRSKWWMVDRYRQMRKQMLNGNTRAGS